MVQSLPSKVRPPFDDLASPRLESPATCGGIGGCSGKPDEHDESTGERER